MVWKSPIVEVWTHNLPLWKRYLNDCITLHYRCVKETESKLSVSFKYLPVRTAKSTIFQTPGKCRWDLWLAHIHPAPGKADLPSECSMMSKCFLSRHFLLVLQVLLSPQHHNRRCIPLKVRKISFEKKKQQQKKKNVRHFRCGSLCTFNFDELKKACNTLSAAMISLARSQSNW